MTDIHGINLAMQTPFDDSGGVDFAGLDRLLDQYLETGLHGFVLSAGTGQHPYLTEDECNKIFAAALNSPLTKSALDHKRPGLIL